MKNQLMLVVGLAAMICTPMCQFSNGPSEDIIGSGNVVTENRQVSGFHGNAVSRIAR